MRYFAEDLNPMPLGRGRSHPKLVLKSATLHVIEEYICTSSITSLAALMYSTSSTWGFPKMGGGTLFWGVPLRGFEFYLGFNRGSPLTPTPPPTPTHVFGNPPHMVRPRVRSRHPPKVACLRWPTPFIAHLLQVKGLGAWGFGSIGFRV